MQWFINLPTRIKFFLGFGAVIALLIIIVIIAGNGISVIQQSQKNLYNSEFANTVDVLTVKSNINDMRVYLLMMMSAKTKEEKARQHKLVEESSGRLAKTMETLLDRNRHEQQALSRLEELGDISLAFKETRETRLIPLIYAGKIDEAKKIALGVQNERYEKMRSIIMSIGKDAQKEAASRMAESDESARRSVRLFIIIGAIAVVISFFIAALSNRIIAQPLKEIAGFAEKITAGDLTIRMPAADRQDEVGLLMKMFATMVDRLRKETRDITEAVNVLASSSNEIAATSSQLASGTQETAVAVAETTTTVEEIKQTANASTQKARHVSDLAQNASHVSQSGAILVNETIDGINRIREQMEYIAETIVKLSEHNQAVSEIIAAVDDLAEQSNLLAVNASIEAAKAGEHGKGFGVVAQEIKSLAEQSKQSTKQVRTILNDIQKASSAAVMATEKGSKAVEATVKQSAQTGEAIRTISKAIEDATQAVMQIAASNQEQLVGMDQVAGAMISIKQASSQNAASTRQVEITVKGLQELGQKLKDMVGHYRL
ncbi:MAG: methyl-accepting chemotaxis protein [Deltaproteobacteria bacterium]|nr:methyl-accepting chemotaxis protein [Deltaproteobacteria bacterium]